jgi:hypothetical protein
VFAWRGFNRLRIDVRREARESSVGLRDVIDRRSA